MLTLESSSHLLEILNDAYTTLSHNLIGFSTLSQERVLQADWLLLENNKHQHALFELKFESTINNHRATQYSQFLSLTYH